MAVPASWSYSFNSTSEVDSVPLAVTMTDLTALSANDAIGCFYLDGATKECAGYALWTGTGAIAIIVFGDDEYTEGKTGFYENDTKYWKIWYEGTDTEVDVVATYSGGDNTWNNSSICSISAFSPATVNIDVSPTTQTLSLTLNAPTVSSSNQVSPDTLNSALTLNSPTLRYSYSVYPDTVSMTSELNDISFEFGTTCYPDPIELRSRVENSTLTRTRTIYDTEVKGCPNCGTLNYL